MGGGLELKEWDWELESTIWKNKSFNVPAEGRVMISPGFLYTCEGETEPAR